MPFAGRSRAQFAPALRSTALKLLLDENLSPRLLPLINAGYPGSVHVLDAGLTGATDRAVWAHAAAHGFVLVTKDEDFHRLSVALGAPPKVIWVRLGNCTIGEVARLLLAHRERIERFIEHEEFALLPLG